MLKVKGSTLVEAIVATLIIVTSFMGLMALATGIQRRAVGYIYYSEMSECRDSVLTMITKGREIGEIIERSWGTLNIADNNGQVCMTAILKSGQRYTIYYLLDEKSEK